MDGQLIRFDKKSTFIFLDMETFCLTLNFIHNLPWSLAMLKVQGDNIIDSKDVLIKWDTKLKISDEAARITRYNYREVIQKGKNPDEVFEIMYDWLNSADYIIGHNILGFDIYLVKEWCLLKDMPWKHFLPKIIDTHALAKGIGLSISYKREDNFQEYQYKMINTIKKGLKTRLEVLGQQYGIEHDFQNLHDAYNDLVLNLKVWNRIKHQIDL